MLHPENATATAPARSSTSRFAFSDAGHSVTSGVDWLAATWQRPCSAGVRGIKAPMRIAGEPEPQPATTNADIPHHPTTPPRKRKLRRIATVYSSELRSILSRAGIERGARQGVLGLSGSRRPADAP